MKLELFFYLRCVGVRVEGLFSKIKLKMTRIFLDLFFLPCQNDNNPIILNQCRHHRNVVDSKMSG